MDDKARNWNPAESFFAILMLLLSLSLLALIQDQVVFYSDKPLHKQPGLWSAIGLIGMSISSLFYLVSLWLSKSTLPRTNYSLISEVWVWCRSIEFLLWFMIYVYIVPILGYLPSTVLFSLLLLMRLGYRKRQTLLISVAISFAIVLIFKSFLQVKIPAGALYENLPEAMRNFFIVYF